MQAAMNAASAPGEVPVQARPWPGRASILASSALLLTVAAGMAHAGCLAGDAYGSLRGFEVPAQTAWMVAISRLAFGLPGLAVATAALAAAAALAFAGLLDPWAKRLAIANVLCAGAVAAVSCWAILSPLVLSVGLQK